MFQKYAHNTAEKTDKKSYQIWTWYMGIVCIIVAQPLYIAAASMANQSTLGVLEPIGIILNIILGKFILGENITKTKLLAIGIFIPGIALTLKYASMETHKRDREEFDNWFYQPFPLIFLGAMMVLLFLGIPASYFIVKKSSEDYKKFDDEYDSDELKKSRRSNLVGSFNSTDLGLIHFTRRR